MKNCKKQRIMCTYKNKHKDHRGQTWKNDEQEFKRVLDIVCKYKGVTVEELMEKSRKPWLVIVRQLIMHFAYRSELVTQKYIADFFNQCRTNVLYGIAKIDFEAQTYRIYREQYNQLAELINPDLLKPEKEYKNPEVEKNFEVFKASQIEQ